MIAKLSGSLVRAPKFMVPSARRATLRPVLPSLTYSIRPSVAKGEDSLLAPRPRLVLCARLFAAWTSRDEKAPQRPRQGRASGKRGASRGRRGHDDDAVVAVVLVAVGCRGAGASRQEEQESEDRITEKKTHGSFLSGGCRGREV